MAQRPVNHVPLDEAVLDLLACPACLGGLSVLEEGLVCVECGRGYPILDGIPVLIAEAAEEPSQTVSSADSCTSIPTRRTE